MKPSRSRFNIIIVAWGDAYIDCLTQVALPSLAPSSKDLTYIKLNQFKFLIYTAACHRNEIAKALSRYFAFAETAYYELNPERYANHYLAMAHAHHHGAEVCATDGAKAIIVAPDAVFSDGALRYVIKGAELGKRAIMVVGPRLSQESVFDYLKGFLSRNGSIKSRELVSTLMQHHHHEMRRYDWSSDDFSSAPYLLLWQASQGWLVRSFHHHPLMIDFSNSNALAVLRNDTIDGNFIGSYIGNWDDIDVIQDSDRLLVCTMTPNKTFYSDKNNQTSSVSFLRSFAFESPIINSFHRWLITKAVKIHAEPLDGRWRELEESTGHLMFQILSTQPLTSAPLGELPELKPMPVFELPERSMTPSYFSRIFRSKSSYKLDRH